MKDIFFYLWLFLAFVVLSQHHARQKDLEKQIRETQMKIERLETRKPLLTQTES